MALLFFYVRRWTVSVHEGEAVPETIRSECTVCRSVGFCNMRASQSTISGLFTCKKAFQNNSWYYYIHSSRFNLLLAGAIGTIWGTTPQPFYT